jgi:precorrin-4/cobalt-precorrin-4 C11-methyltransferase
VISFVGAGPGAPDLITVRGAERLAAADVVIWAGSLVGDGLLERCRPDAVVHDSKGMTLAAVCAVYAAHPDAAIVRLHSGDTSVYSAVGEQIAWCRRHDRAFEIIPGVSSMAAAAALAECELTIPGVAQSVVMTRLAVGTAASMPAAESIGAFSATGATMAIFLSVAHVDELARVLAAPPSAFTAATPVVVAHRASWPDGRLVHTTVGAMAADVRAAGFQAATLFLVGPALAGGDPACPSHVYASGYATRFRPASTDG